MSRFGRRVESFVFSSRWLVAPFLFGLVFGLVGLLYKFCYKVFDFAVELPQSTDSDVIVRLLSLIDLALIANLIVIVICSSYENFVRPIEVSTHPNWPRGLTGIGYASLKQKLLGSIVAITAVKVLEWFMDIDQSVDPVKLTWVVGILIAYSFAMLILALADMFSAKTNK